MNRRRFLTLAGGTISTAVLAGCGSGLPWSATARQGSTGALLRSSVPLPEPYTVPLPVPPTLRPNAAGLIELSAVVRDLEILPGRTTRALTYGASFPGPTISAEVGRPLEVRLRNHLDIATVVHLHGGVTPPDHDGFPTDFVHPGATRAYRYPLEQRAATLWYHDHTMDRTGPNVYAGLAGAFIVNDPREADLGLPSGARDLPLVVCDRAFGQDAEFAYPGMPDGRGVQERYHGGVLGDCVLVNGAPWPVLEVDAARYRFRLLNASNARRYEFTLDHGLDFTQVGSDQGLLERPWERTSLTLAGGERADVVLDFSGLAPDTRVTMTNALAGGGPGQVMRFVVTRRAPDESRVPERLSTIEPIEESLVVATRDLHFALGPAGPGTPMPTGHDHGGPTGDEAAAHPHQPSMELAARGLWSVNGATWLNGKDAATMRLGTVERWRLSSDVHHPVHAHLVHSLVEDRQGGRMWKDTIDLRPGSAVEVVVPVTGFRGRFVMHCHNLEHEDMMMMVPFSVI